MIREIWHLKNERTQAIVNINETNTGFCITAGKQDAPNSWLELQLTDAQASKLANVILRCVRTIEK